MEIQALINIATDLGLTPLNLVLLTMLYFMGASSGIFPKFWKKENEDVPTLKQIFETMTHLKAHYNDETTENLEKIGRNQETMIGGIKEIRENQKVIAKDVEELKQSNAIIKEFGVKIRKST
jgi:hypothetical protein